MDRIFQIEMKMKIIYSKRALHLKDPDSYTSVVPVISTL